MALLTVDKYGHVWPLSQGIRIGSCWGDGGRNHGSDLDPQRSTHPQWHRLRHGGRVQNSAKRVARGPESPSCQPGQASIPATLTIGRLGFSYNKHTTATYFTALSNPDPYQ